MAEAADTVRSPGRSDLAARFSGTAIALRGLRGFPILLWIAGFGAIAATGDAFTSAPIVPMTVALCLTAALRVVVMAPSIDPLRLNEEIVRTVYQVPGSISAAPGLVAHTEPLARPSSATTLVPSRLLMLVGLLLCLAIGQGIAGLMGTVPVESAGIQGWGMAASAVVLLMLIQAIAYSGSLRRSGSDSYRFPVDIRATVDGRQARTIDISAGGLRLKTQSDLLDAAEVEVTVDFAGKPMKVTGQVRHVQHVGEETVAGIRLTDPADDRCQWVRSLFAEAGILENPPVPSEPRTSRSEIPTGDLRNPPPASI